MVSQFVPPGSLLKPKPNQVGPEVHVFKDQNFDSPWNNVEFNEVMTYTQLTAQEKIGIVLEVKSYNPLKKESEEWATQQLGWTYFPVFLSVQNEDGSHTFFTHSG